MAVSKNDILSGKSGSFDGTDTEWQQLVFDALFSLGPEDITLSAQINKAKDKITVTVQRVDEEEFTVRLGSVEILEDEDAEVDLIEWLTESASATIAAKTRSHKLEETTNVEQDAINKLQAQLDELVKAKEDHETLLITKFNMLLNSKKAKIRELTNNGAVPEARIPPSSDEEDEAAKEEEESEQEPASKKPKVKGSANKTKNTATKGKATSSRGKTTASSSKAGRGKGKTVVAIRRTASPASKRDISTAKGKRKRTPTPEPEEDVDMEGEETADEDSVQGDEERDADVERTFGLRGDDEGEVTEDEEL